MVLLPSLCWCHCQHCMGTVALVALTLLSLLCWPLPPPHCMGVVTLVAPALLPPLSWRVCTIVLVSLTLSRWLCCPWYAGIRALVAQPCLPLLCLHCAVDSQVSLPSMNWHVLSCWQCSRPCCRGQRQHQCKKGNGTSTTRAAVPSQWGQ